MRRGLGFYWNVALIIGGIALAVASVAQKAGLGIFLGILIIGWNFWRLTTRGKPRSPSGEI